MPLAHWQPKHLTPRMSQCLLLLAKGNTTRGVAIELGVAEKTANKFRQAVLDYYDASGTTEAVVLALKRGDLLLDSI